LWNTYQTRCVGFKKASRTPPTRQPSLGPVCRRDILIQGISLAIIGRPGWDAPCAVEASRAPFQHHDLQLWQHSECTHYMKYCWNSVFFARACTTSCGTQTKLGAWVSKGVQDASHTTALSRPGVPEIYLIQKNGQIDPCVYGRCPGRLFSIVIVESGMHPIAECMRSVIQLNPS
jgi:hypothetical protein